MRARSSACSKAYGLQTTLLLTCARNRRAAGCHCGFSAPGPPTVFPNKENCVRTLSVRLFVVLGALSIGAGVFPQPNAAPRPRCGSRNWRRSTSFGSRPGTGSR